MTDKNLQTITDKAITIANEYHHQHVTCEHLLLALLDDVETHKIFEYYKIDTEILKKNLQLYLKHNIVEFINKDDAMIAKPTSDFQRIIQRTEMHGQANGVQNVGGIYVIAEFFFEQNVYAVQALRQCKLTRQHVLRYLVKNHVNDSEKQLHNKLKNKTTQENKDQFKNKTNNFEDSKNQTAQQSQFQFDMYCSNLNAKAMDGNIDCLIGRENEIQRTIEILCRRRKNNALLVGEPGVGKTAIAEGLALRIIQNEVPDILQNSVIYALDIGSVVAGAKYRGDFEDRMKKIFAELKNRPEVILFIDEIHTIIGAGSTTSGSLDASNLLKPAFAKGELRCIGSTTFREYHNYFEKDMALVRRFQKIIVNEPDEKTAMNILHGLKSYYEKYHNVKYDDSAISAAVILSTRYINDRHLPDKAIDLVDEAGARKNLNTHNLQTVPIITEKDIEELVSTIANIPSISVGEDDITQLRHLEANLKQNIFGQDEAISKLCANIKLSRAGLKKHSRPIGCYLFAGATGVGKTALAKHLARFCNMELIQCDMSEFSESHSISKLVGSPPGYSGFEQGGQLTEEVDKKQYSVILFDEVEKAHPEILNILLQIMDEGTLTDNTGKVINFTHSIIILTTNIGAEIVTKTPLGFGNNDYSKKYNAAIESVHNIFSAELRNRLDSIIIFNALNAEILYMIIEKALNELSCQLKERDVQIAIDKSVTKYLTQNCLHQESGARVLDRMIDNIIKQPIADEILFGKLQNGGKVIVNTNDSSDKLQFKFTSKLKHNKAHNALELT